jgi:signal transduction histidine kinase
MQLLRVALENEMDLTLAYKKSIKAAQLLDLSLSTQTAFATAISEVCREVIDKTHEGLVSVEIESQGERLNLVALITYRESKGMPSLREGLAYAQKLVPVFNFSVVNSLGTIELKLAIPRAAKVDKATIQRIKTFFEKVEPLSPYEEIKQQNQQLSEINEQSEVALRQAEYLNDQKGEFLAVAGHELKTPLTILRAYTQMALRSENLEQVLSHLQKVDTQALKLQKMISQLLDISKIETGKADYQMETVDFKVYIEDMSDLIRQLVPAHDLVILLDNSASVTLDKLRMEQVMMNIAGNAAKYSPAGKQIILRTKIQTDGQLLVSFQDEGIGMSAVELQKVFDKFYRIEEITKFYNGLGMGLYICSKIVSDHGGKIWVESEKDEGCTFYFTLPLSDKPSLLR